MEGLEGRVGGRERIAVSSSILEYSVKTANMYTFRNPFMWESEIHGKTNRWVYIYIYILIELLPGIRGVRIRYCAGAPGGGAPNGFSVSW